MIKSLSKVTIILTVVLLVSCKKDDPKPEGPCFRCTILPNSPGQYVKDTCGPQAEFAQFTDGMGNNLPAVCVKLY